MSLSVKHTNVPEGFEYSVKFNTHTEENILSHIQVFYNIKQTYYKNDTMYAIPETGLYLWDDVECWVYNQEKQGYIVMYFKSQEQYKLLNDNIQAKKASRMEKVKNKLYRYSPNYGWNLVESYATFDEKSLIGYNHYFKVIEAEIENHKKNQKVLETIGEYKSLNYLLYGVPGTGKTTLIKALSTKYDMEIYVVNSIVASSANIGHILNPLKQSKKHILLIFEDFDRFIVNAQNKELMGVILNAMDGFDDAGNTIRFFTGNDCSAIFEEKALINRISGKYRFDYPTGEMLKAKLLKLLETVCSNTIDENKVDEFICLVENKNITLRPFTSYCIKYLFSENNLDDMIANVADLF